MTRPRSRSTAARAGSLVAAPIATLVLGSFHTDAGWSLANYRALTSVGSNDALLVPVTDALVTSLRTAVDATWMALLDGPGRSRVARDPSLADPRPSDVRAASSTASSCCRSASAR